MANVLLGVTGSVAAIRTPAMAEALRSGGKHEVRVVATDPAVHFFDPSTVGTIHRDPDEWPPDRWGRDDPVLHIALRDWADVLVLAPLDANSLGKIALGLCDNLLTCVVRAWDFSRPIVFAPAMNTKMWDSPVTRRHLRLLLDDHGDGRHGSGWSLDDAASVFARHAAAMGHGPPRQQAPGVRRRGHGRDGGRGADRGGGRKGVGRIIPVTSSVDSPKTVRRAGTGRSPARS